MVQESKAKVQQQVQQLQAKLGQQAAEIAQLQVHQGQAAQPSLVAACQSDDNPGAAAGQPSTSLKPHLHRQKERPDVNAAPKMASLIRYDHSTALHDKQSHTCTSSVPCSVGRL